MDMVCVLVGVCLSVQGANKHSWYAALSLAVTAEVVEKSRNIPLPAGLCISVCVYEEKIKMPRLL